MKLVLIGNYGVGNLGDEALKQYFLQKFPGIDWVVASAWPATEEVPRLPMGIGSIFTPWWRTLRVYWASDGVVFGGGSLFTDTESAFACVLWWWHAFFAWMLHKPIILAFQGIGPFHTTLGEWCTRFVVSRADYLSVRDASSLERAASWTNKKVVLSFDPVFSLLEAEKNHKRTKKLIIIPRTHSSENFLRKCRELAAEDWQKIEIVVLDAKDTSIASKIQTAIGRDVTVRPVTSLGALSEALRGVSMVCTQRYHGAVAALAMGIPFVAVAQKPGDKLDMIGRMERDEASDLVKKGEESLRKYLIPD